jgi:LuxR family transcriptional regulator
MPRVAVSRDDEAAMNALVHMQRIVEARTPEELWALLLDRLAGYGFDRVIYGFTRYQREGSVGDRDDIVYLSNLDRGAVRDYLDMSFFLRTPMFRWVSQHVGACSWRWAEQELAAGRLTEDEIAAMVQARALGLQAGWSISFPELSLRARGAMGLTAQAGLTQDDADAAWTRWGDEILAICNMTHLRLTHMPFRVSRRPLSPRQREALEWVGDGKTTQDIATIMGLTSATVEKHLRLAREALDVETTAQAVLKASFQNQIFVLPA